MYASRTLLGMSTPKCGAAYAEFAKYAKSGGRVARSRACKTAPDIANPQAPPAQRLKFRLDIMTARRDFAELA